MSLQTITLPKQICLLPTDDETARRGYFVLIDIDSNKPSLESSEGFLDVSICLSQKENASTQHRPALSFSVSYKEIKEALFDPTETNNDSSVVLRRAEKCILSKSNDALLLDFFDNYAHQPVLYDQKILSSILEQSDVKTTETMTLWRNTIDETKIKRPILYPFPTEIWVLPAPDCRLWDSQNYFLVLLSDISPTKGREPDGLLSLDNIIALYSDDKKSFRHVLAADLGETKPEFVFIKPVTEDLLSALRDNAPKNTLDPGYMNAEEKSLSLQFLAMKSLLAHLTETTSPSEDPLRLLEIASDILCRGDIVVRETTFLKMNKKQPTTPRP